jgi:hypothetical protein
MTILPGTILPEDISSEGHFFKRTFLPEDNSSGGHFFRVTFLLIPFLPSDIPSNTISSKRHSFQPHYFRVTLVQTTFFPPHFLSTPFQSAFPKAFFWTTTLRSLCSLGSFSGLSFLHSCLQAKAKSQSPSTVYSSEYNRRTNKTTSQRIREKAAPLPS